MGSMDEGDPSGSEHIAAISSTCEDERPKVVFLQQCPALFLHAEVCKTEHPADSRQLFIINFQNVASAHGVAEHFLCVEVLAQVDVKYL